MFVCETDGSGFPMATCTLLTVPGSFASGTLVFNAPAGTTLSAGTTYTVVATPGGGTVTLTLDATTADAEDTGGATGWTLADAYDWRDGSNMWQTISTGKSLRVAIKGSAAVIDVAVVPVRRTTDSLQVFWSAGDNAGTPAITGYDVRYRETGNWTTVRQDAPSTSVIITGLVSSGYYDVQVRAVTTGSSGPWSSTAEGVPSPPSERVYANHPMIPDDLGPGDSFRLLYVTEAAGGRSGMTTATDTGIHDYRDFVSSAVYGLIEAGGLVVEWGPIFVYQVSLLSTPGADARLLTDTTWTSTDRGVPIYWLNGARVADDYADFYDGAWENEDKPRNGSGTLYSPADPPPWTGTDHDGTELFDGAASRAMGQATVGVGAPGSTAVGAGPLNGAAAFASTEERPLYGLWPVMVVDENLRLVTNYHQPESASDSNDTRAAVRAQLFTTGPHSSGYGIGEITVWRGSRDDSGAFLGAVALYTTDAAGDPDLVDGLHATLSLEGTTRGRWRIVGTEGLVLKPRTTYALVFEGESGSYPDLSTIGANGEDVPADGWSLADALVYYSGSAWEENSNGNSLEIEMIGPALETDGPALVSATVGAAGNAVALAFDEDVALPSDSADALTFLASLASAFDLRADGESVAVSGLTASGTDGLTLGLSGVPDVINNSTINVPGAPRNLVATASGTTRINLSWSAPASNGGFAIIGYRIEVSPNGNSNWTELVANTGNPNMTFAHTVVAGTTRHYRVLAINARGSGIPSGVANDTTNEEETSSVVVPDPPPFSPPTEEEVGNPPTEEEVENPPTQEEVGNPPTEEVEEGCAVSDVTGDDRSLEIFVECAAQRIEDSDTFTETLRILEGFRDDEGNWNDGSTYLVLLTARGGVYFHANNREVEDLDWSGILLCEGEESVLDTQEGCLIEGARMGYAHPFSASHVPLARGEEKFVLLGGFNKIPEEGKPFTGMIGEPSTEAGEVDTDDELRKFVGEAGRVLREAVSDTEIDPAELRGILRREGPWREGDVYLYIMSEMGRVIFDGAKRDREQKNEYGKQYVRDLIEEAGEEIVEYREDDFLIRGYTARVEVPLDEEGEDSRVYFVGSGYRVEGGQPGGSGCAVGGSGKGGAFGLFLAALTLLLAVLLKRRLADGKAR